MVRWMNKLAISCQTVSILTRRLKKPRCCLLKALLQHYGADAVKDWLEIEPYKALKQTVISHGANRVALVPADPKDLVAPSSSSWAGWAKQLLVKS